jgi:hypothetical protein
MVVGVSAAVLGQCESTVGLEDVWHNADRGHCCCVKLLYKGLVATGRLFIETCKGCYCALQLDRCC